MEKMEYPAILNTMDYYFTFTHKEQITPDMYYFHFTPNVPVPYTSGQYMEFHLPHAHADSRGEKRYFTLVSSPTEKDICIATRINDASSSFKKALLAMHTGTTLRVNELEGDFIVPDDPLTKILLIAGGIGITPYRSMIKYIIDSNLKRDIALMYTAKTTSDILFKDLFDCAHKDGVTSRYYVDESLPTGWDGEKGYITPKIIKKDVPDYLDRMVYVSGPEAMVEKFEKMILKMGVADNNFKRDFFDNYTETYQESS